MLKQKDFQNPVRQETSREMLQIATLDGFV